MKILFLLIFIFINTPLIADANNGSNISNIKELNEMIKEHEVLFSEKKTKDHEQHIIYLALDFYELTRPWFNGIILKRCTGKTTLIEECSRTFLRFEDDLDYLSNIVAESITSNDTKKHRMIKQELLSYYKNSLSKLESLYDHFDSDYYLENQEIEFNEKINSSVWKNIQRHKSPSSEKKLEEELQKKLQDRLSIYVDENSLIGSFQGQNLEIPQEFIDGCHKQNQFSKEEKISLCGFIKSINIYKEYAQKVYSFNLLDEKLGGIKLIKLNALNLAHFVHEAYYYHEILLKNIKNPLFLAKLVKENDIFFKKYYSFLLNFSYIGAFDSLTFLSNISDMLHDIDANHPLSTLKRVVSKNLSSFLISFLNNKKKVHILNMANSLDSSQDWQSYTKTPPFLVLLRAQIGLSEKNILVNHLLFRNKIYDPYYSFYSDKNRSFGNKVETLKRFHALPLNIEREDVNKNRYSNNLEKQRCSFSSKLKESLSENSSRYSRAFNFFCLFFNNTQSVSFDSILATFKNDPLIMNRGEIQNKKDIFEHFNFLKNYQALISVYNLCKNSCTSFLRSINDVYAYYSFVKQIKLVYTKIYIEHNGSRPSSFRSAFKFFRLNFSQKEKVQIDFYMKDHVKRLLLRTEVFKGDKNV